MHEKRQKEGYSLAINLGWNKVSFRLHFCWRPFSHFISFSLLIFRPITTEKVVHLLQMLYAFKGALVWKRTHLGIICKACALSNAVYYFPSCQPRLIYFRTVFLLFWLSMNLRNSSKLFATHRDTLQLFATLHDSSRLFTTLCDS